MTMPRIEAKMRLFTRHWVCGVLRSGYHNGATCNERDPHDGWGCGWRLEASLPDTETNRAIVAWIEDRESDES